jgi:hypothetical protein
MDHGMAVAEDYRTVSARLPEYTQPLAVNGCPLQKCRRRLLFSSVVAAC